MNPLLICGSKPKTKCVISAVDMWSKEKKSDDKVNLYIYDKKKYAHPMWRRHWKHMVEDEVPIGCVNYCHVKASYITFGSHLFRIGGTCLSYTDRENFYKKIKEARHADDPNVVDSDVYLDLISSEMSATNTVDIIDLNRNDDLMVAIEGPKMLCERLRPHLLILQGNLYVAGGFHNYDGDDVAFMEVLNRSAPAIEDWFWEPLPNPPPYCVSSLEDRPELPERVITGAVESEGVIIAGFYMACDYCFYTYQPTTKMWTTSENLRPPVPDLGCLTLNPPSPAVVFDKFMLWLPWRSGPPTLYIMDRGNNAVVTIELLDKKFLPQDGLPFAPSLLKLKEGEEWEFGVFWQEYDGGPDYPGPKYSSGLDTYVGLRASIFTLEVKKDGTLHVQPKKRFFSLIPNKSPGLGLIDVCIADVPDSKRGNKQRWTTFC